MRHVHFVPKKSDSDRCGHVRAICGQHIPEKDRLDYLCAGERIEVATTGADGVVQKRLHSITCRRCIRIMVSDGVLYEMATRGD